MNEFPEGFEILGVENPRTPDVLAEAVAVAKFFRDLVSDAERRGRLLNRRHFLAYRLGSLLGTLIDGVALFIVCQKNLRECGGS